MQTLLLKTKGQASASEERLSSPLQSPLRSRLQTLVRVLIDPVILAALFIVFIASALAHPSAALAAGSPPTWGLPYASGTSGLYTGVSGLHGCNFTAIDSYTFANPSSDCSSPQSDASLDIGFNGSDSSGNGAAPAVALAAGTVLDANASCNLVLIDEGNGWWAIYIHLVNLQVSTGQHVNAGQTLGTPNKNVTACGQSVYGNFPHVHFALLNSTGSHTATYVSMAGQVLCGSTVLSNAQAPGGPVGSGWVNNLQGLTSPFTVPSACGSSTSPSLAITSGISLSSSVTPIGQSFSESVQFTNNTGSAFTYNGLQLVAIEPSGNWAVLQSSPGTTMPNNTTWTYNYSTSTFLSGCATCTGGYYKIDLMWQDASSHWHDLATNGGSNDVSEYVPSSVSGFYNPVNQTYTLLQNIGGTLYANNANANGWTGWSAFDTTGLSGVTLVGKPYFIVDASGLLEGFARDSSGNIWWEHSSATGWLGWNEFAGITAADDPNVAIAPDGGLLLTVTATNGNVYWEEEHSWGWIGSWQAFQTGPYLTQSPIMLLNGSNVFEAISRDANGNVWIDQQNTSGVWQGWFEEGGPVVPSGNHVAAVYNPSSTAILVYAIGSDGNLWELDDHYTWFAAWQNALSTGSNALGTALVGNPTVVMGTSNDIEIFAQTSSSVGLIWHNMGSVSGAWQPWNTTPYGSNIGFLGEPAIYVNPQTGTVSIYSVAGDGNTYGLDKHPGSSPWFSAWYNLGY